ncbi:MAG: hypothetical protein ACTSUE_05445 [Promethearchaeota archaeon]
MRMRFDDGSKYFRFSIDDNIIFLKELAENPEKYPSLFDHEYLRFWREMHEEFGTKFHFNIYYQTEGFNLTMMPDAWKEEWKGNASWLNLSFHALQDKPDKPYINADYETFAADYDNVLKEIERFAGKEVISKTTTVHWGEGTLDVVKCLRERDIEILIGLFIPEDGSGSYHLSPAQIERINKEVVLKDELSGMTFVECLIVVNLYAPEEIVPKIVDRLSSRENKDIVEFLIHEQYFLKDSPYYEIDYYQEDVKEKVKNSLQWASDNGYRSIFWDELLDE